MAASVAELVFYMIFRWDSVVGSRVRSAVAAPGMKAVRPKSAPHNPARLFSSAPICYLFMPADGWPSG